MEKKVIPVALLCLCWLASCPRTETDAPTPVDPAGVYTLVTVNGSGLPSTVSHGEAEIVVHSGTFTIQAHGTCSSKVIFGSPSGDTIEREVRATYTQKGSRLDMKWQGAGKTQGTLDGDTFTMNNEGILFSYQR